MKGMIPTYAAIYQTWLKDMGALDESFVIVSEGFAV